MTVIEIAKNKERQREIISFINDNEVELSELLKLQKELNKLMKENTEEKQKTYWSKTFDRVVGNKKWDEITIYEFVELRHAGLSGYAIAEHFGISRSVVFNYTRNNRTDYYQLFDMGEYQRNKEIWND
ncbi:DUF2481 domain-containing protein [Listeria monocytogenes]|nr:DUF2481 domain-containing protein [Listeria monocytogenes]EAD0271789.1 DUF2481 domain-containing protein [Listeria monocytogenes]EAF9608455.1 DUF2481 domain-containing protein [Listeria monocytogenes]